MIDLANINNIPSYQSRNHFSSWYIYKYWEHVIAHIYFKRYDTYHDTHEAIFDMY